MGKREFLEILSGRLSEELPRDLVVSHLQYYDEYINGELEKGRKLADIMNELGDPILIAHTIINRETGESFRGYAEDADFVEIPKEEYINGNEFQKESVSEEKNVEYTHLDTENEEERQAREYEQANSVLKKNNQMGCLIVGILGVVILFAVLSLLGGLIGILLPILLPVFVVLLVFSFIFGKRK